jgi:hypothetical protein
VGKSRRLATVGSVQCGTGADARVALQMRHFIMLLSTDWFWPFWSEIGLDVDTATKLKIREGCREIVRDVIAHVAADEISDFECIDWSPAGESEAKLRFERLLESLKAKPAVSAVAENWIAENHEDHMGATLMLRLFTHELIEAAETEVHSVPDFSIRAKVADAIMEYEIDPSQFEDIAMKSATTWDSYVRSLFEAIPDEVPPTALATYLQPNVRIHRAKVLWNRVRDRLSANQQNDLLSWYRAMAKTRMPLDPVPSFVREHVNRA